MIAPMLVESPRMFPGTCVDGSQGTPQEQVVDTGYELINGYRIYLSRRMIRDCARLYGMVEQAEYEALDARLAECECRVSELAAECAVSRPVLKAAAEAARSAYAEAQGIPLETAR